MKSNRNALQEQIKKILLKDWDPIGINSVPEAQDEYDLYVPKIGEMLLNKRSFEEIFKYLHQIECSRMGLKGDDKSTKKVVIKLVKLTARYNTRES